MSQPNHYADVAAFNEACGVYRVKTFGDPLPPGELTMRRRLVAEEYTELMYAIKDNDRVEIADACADLAYVAIGWMWAVRYFKPIGVITDGPTIVKAELDASVKNTLFSQDPFEAWMIASLALSLGKYYGFPMDAVWREVQRSNMAKIVNGVVSKRADGKIVKPQGWTPPDIRGILEREGAL